MIGSKNGKFPQGIQVTKNYDQFQYVEGNRNVKDGHVADLTINIMKKNMLAQNPIIVNEKMQVIDGQHRLEVAKNNNFEIFYIIVPGAKIEEVELLNSANRPWTITDYINSYASRGNQSYLWLKEFMGNYSLNLTHALIFVYGGDNTWGYKKIRKGEFAPTEDQKTLAKDRADVLWDMRPYINKKGFLPKAFVKAVVDIHSKGNGRKLANEVIKKGKPFIPSTYVKDAGEQLQAYL